MSGEGVMMRAKPVLAVVAVPLALCLASSCSSMTPSGDSPVIHTASPTRSATMSPSPTVTPTPTPAPTVTPLLPATTAPTVAPPAPAPKPSAKSSSKPAPKPTATKTSKPAPKPSSQIYKCDVTFVLLVSNGACWRRCTRLFVACDYL